MNAAGGEGAAAGGPTPTRQAPGDEAPAGVPGTGERICPDCGGSGRTNEGTRCPTCEGRGRIVGGIGGG